MLSIGDSKEPLDKASKDFRHRFICDKFIPYLESSLEVDFKWMGNSLHKLRQDDSSSCGPCTINFLEQLVHNQVIPWTPQGAASYRISLFLQMSQYALEKMVGLQDGSIHKDAKISLG